MNIFVVDHNPEVAACMLCDKHVVKMVLESAQILSTVAGGPYKPTHTGHPCVLWAKQNQINFRWLMRHAWELCQEYTRRYGRIHKSQAVIQRVHDDFDSRVLPVGFTDFVQCMPDMYRDRDAIRAYRKYYHSKTFAEWKYTQPPYWWGQEEYVTR